MDWMIKIWVIQQLSTQLESSSDGTSVEEQHPASSGEAVSSDEAQFASSTCTVQQDKAVMPQADMASCKMKNDNMMTTYLNNAKVYCFFH